jgi:hypothetical protein
VDAGLLALDGLQVLLEQLRRRRLPPAEPLVEVADDAYGSASWMALTTK